MTQAPTRGRQQQAAPQPQPQQPAADNLDAPLLDQVIDNTAKRLDEAALRYQGEIDAAGLGQLRRSMLLAHAISRLESALEPLKNRILMLQDSPLGFLTDRDPARSRDGKTVQPYGWTTVRRCVVQALLAGFNLTGNEWNIIGGKFYGAQAGWERKVREIPGLTDLLPPTPGVPTLREGFTCVRVAASWKKDGLRQELLGADGKPGRVFPIIVNSNSSPDAILGKAVAKAYRAIYQRVTGTSLTEPDEELPAAPPAADTTSAEALLEEDRLAAAHDLAHRVSVAETRPALDDLDAEVLRQSEYFGPHTVRQLRESVEARRRELAGPGRDPGEEG